MTWKRPTGARAAGLGHVAGVAAHALVAARAERERALAGQDDHADVGVLARRSNASRQLDDGLRAERVADLGPVDRDLRDPDRRRPSSSLVADVLVLGGGDPGDRHGAQASFAAHARRSWLAARRAHPAPSASRGRRRRADLRRAARARATRAARVLRGARRRRPASGSALALPPGSTSRVALHACLLLGAAAVPVDLRAPERARGRAAPRSSSTSRCPPTADADRRPAEHDLDAPAIVVHTSGTTGDAAPVELTSATGCGARSARRVALGARPGRALAVHAAARRTSAGCRSSLRSAIYATTASCTRASTPTRALASAARRADHARLARRRRRSPAARRRAASARRRCAARCSAARPFPPGLLARAADAGVPVAPDLRADRGLLAGHDRRPRRPPARRRTAAVLHARAIADDGEILVARPTVAPGRAGAGCCTPATSARSTATGA